MFNEISRRIQELPYWDDRSIRDVVYDVVMDELGYDRIDEDIRRLVDAIMPFVTPAGVSILTFYKKLDMPIGYDIK